MFIDRDSLTSVQDVSPPRSGGKKILSASEPKLRWHEAEAR